MTGRSAETVRRLLVLYPRSWRERYGEELVGLCADMGTGVTWLMLLNVVLAAARERIRALTRLGREGEPSHDVRRGVTAVLWAWAAFIPAGVLVQKTSEHWQKVTHGGHRGAEIAFAILVIGAVIVSALIMIAILAAAPAAVRALRGGAWPRLRRRVWTAIALSILFAAATVTLVTWAHGLSPAQREGRDGSYAAGFVAWGAWGAITLAGWTAVAATTADVIDLAAVMARLQSRIACLAAIGMGVMAVSTCAWYGLVADRAPAALTGGPAAPAAPLFVGRLIAATGVMVLAAVLAAAGARRATIAAPRLT